MLRPSRPMMRPLSSSDLSSTTETVVSTAWPDAIRCITVERMLRARRSASVRASSSTWRISRALSWRSSSSSSFRRICLACPVESPATRSSSRIWSRLASLSCSRPCVEVAPAVVQRALEVGELRALSGPRSSPWPAGAPPGGPARSAGPRSSLLDVAALRRGSRRGSGSSVRSARRGRGEGREGARALDEEHHAHRDSRRHQRCQHDLHLRVSSVRRVAAPVSNGRAVRLSAARRQTKRLRPARRVARRTCWPLWTFPNAPPGSPSPGRGSRSQLSRGPTRRSYLEKVGDLLVVQSHGGRAGRVHMRVTTHRAAGNRRPALRRPQATPSLVLAQCLVRKLGRVPAPHEQTPGAVAFAVVLRRLRGPAGPAAGGRCRARPRGRAPTAPPRSRPGPPHAGAAPRQCAPSPTGRARACPST